MRHVGESSQRRGTPTGWLVKASQGYYTGNRRSVLEGWSTFPKFAKIYQRKAWALKMAARLGGQVVPVAELIGSTAGADNRSHPQDRV